MVHRNAKLSCIAVLLCLGVQALIAAEDFPPRAIAPKNDVCFACHMKVEDSGYAVELIDEDNKVLIFDSLVESVVWAHKVKKEKGKEPWRGHWVQDATTRTWVRVHDAFFVYTKEVPTPMNDGVHAFATSAEAESFLANKKDGKLVLRKELESFSNK